MRRARIVKLLSRCKLGAEMTYTRKDLDGYLHSFSKRFVFILDEADYSMNTQCRSQKPGQPS
jgi:hypothetical protein